MKYKFAMWIMGIIIMLSGQCYALDEKITVTPSRESAHVFDITVSGKTNTPMVSVVHNAYIEQATEDCAFTDNNCYYFCGVWKRTIRLYVAIKKCGEPFAIPSVGTPSVKPADYSHTFRWYCSGYPDLSVVELYIRENPTVSEYTDYGSYRMAAKEEFSYGYYDVPDSLRRSATAISIGKTTFEVKGTDTFTAHQVSLPGYDGLYWGTFQWNPYTLSWILRDAGLEK